MRVDSALVTITNPGCVPIALDSFSLISGVPQFAFSPLLLPLIIPADSTIATTLYFSGDATVLSPIFDTIRTSDATGHIETVAVIGSTLPLDTVHVGIALSPGSTLSPIPGGITSPMLVFEDSVPAASGLQSIRCVLTFNGNILSELGTATGLSGWSIQQTSSSGSITLNATRAPGPAIPARQPIASLNLESMLSDSISTPISLSSVTFSPLDPAYEQCMLASAINPSSIQIQLAAQCADSLILLALRGEPLLGVFSVIPQESDLLVTFQSAEMSEVTLILMDILGRTLSEISYQATQGPNAVTIPTSNIGQGVYFVQLSSGDVRMVRQVAILR